MMYPTSFYDLTAIENLRKKVRLEPHYQKYWRNAICKQGVSPESALCFLPQEEQRRAFSQIDYHPLTLQARYDSQQDGATKLLFLTQDQHPVEAVILRIQSGRTSLCISSQVGCTVGCLFCATGKMGFRRNLTTAEILDQVAQAITILRPENRRLRNIVFMGMGEPLFNTDQLFPALDLLSSPQWFELSDRHLTLSTVGIIDKIKQWGGRYHDMSFALSLHSARQEIRNRLIPLAKHYPLEDLKEVCRYITPKSSKRYVMLEYLMFKDLTDTDQDIEALSRWCDGLPIHLNIIRCNMGNTQTSLLPSDDDRIQLFADRLRERVSKVTFRCSLGGDILSACGQLAGKHQAENSIS